MTTVWGYVVTFISGAVVSWAGDWIKETRLRKQKLNWFITSLIDDLEAAQVLFAGIENDYQKTGYFSAEYTAKLRANRLVYDRYHEHLLQLDEKLRKRIQSYYIETNWLMTYLESTSLKIFEFKMFVENSVANMKVLRPEMDQNHIQNIVTSALSERIKLMDVFEFLVKQKIESLSQHKIEAKLILEQLKVIV